MPGFQSYLPNCEQCSSRPTTTPNIANMKTRMLTTLPFASKCSIENNPENAKANPKLRSHLLADDYTSSCTSATHDGMAKRDKSNLRSWHQ